MGETSQAERDLRVRAWKDGSIVDMDPEVAQPS